MICLNCGTPRRQLREQVEEQPEDEGGDWTDHLAAFVAAVAVSDLPTDAKKKKIVAALKLIDADADQEPARKPKPRPSPAQPEPDDTDDADAEEDATSTSTATEARAFARTIRGINLDEARSFSRAVRGDMPPTGRRLTESRHRARVSRHMSPKEFAALLKGTL